MKNYLPLLLSLTMTVALARKRTQKAEKEFKSGAFEAASKILTDNEALFATADEKTANAYNFLKGRLALQNKEYQAAFEIFTALNDDARLKSEVQEQIAALSSALITVLLKPMKNRIL